MVSYIGAETTEEIEAGLKKRIAELEAKIITETNASRKKMLQQAVDKFKNKDVTLIPKEGDQWHLMEIVFEDDEDVKRKGFSRTTTANKNGFSSSSVTTNPDGRGGQAITTRSYDMKVLNMPKSLKPGQTFIMSARTTNTMEMKMHRANGKVEKSEGTWAGYYTPFMYRGVGKSMLKGRGMKEVVHVTPDGKRALVKKSTLTKEIVRTKPKNVLEKSMRVKVPDVGIRAPYILRYGFRCSGITGDMRVVFVYKFNYKPVPKFEVKYFDANPKFNPKFNENVLPNELKSIALVHAKDEREGTTADGVSKLIIRAEVPDKEKVTFSLKEAGSGTLEPLLEGKTIRFEEKNYAFALYTPPKRFQQGSAPAPTATFHPDSQPKQRLKGILEYRDVELVVRYRGKEQASKVKLARPPVVLVHGLSSDPYTCWVETKETGTSMMVLLEKAGMLPFLVNYETTNGGLGNGAKSSFWDNRNAVWDRADPFKYVDYRQGWLIKGGQKPPALSEFQAHSPRRIGGIKHALEYYRNDLKLAATQADVIGHSMGGLLARAHASAHYNPNYKRAENFMKGDIHRLITLNTPHHGSELTHAYHAMSKVWVKNESYYKALTRSIPVLYSYWKNVESPAVTDLTAPLTEEEASASALRKLGKTNVPSFAIITTANQKDMNTSTYDKAMVYRQVYGSIGLFFFHNRPLLDDFIKDRFSQWDAAPERLKKNSNMAERKIEQDRSEKGIERYRKSIFSAIDDSAFYWESRRDAEYKKDLHDRLSKTPVVPFGYYDRRDAGLNDELYKKLKRAGSYLITDGDYTKLTETSREQDVPPEVMHLLRELIFHNDPLNDGAVRAESQRGGLVKPHFYTVDHTLHSYSPWTYAVQKKVINLLKWEDQLFAEQGFPQAGDLLPRYLPSETLSKARVTGEKAIRWSGVVQSHAYAYAKVADKNKVFVLVRPVNRDSTKLIENNMATKAMAVKGKSSNWGPQKGYIPYNQTYSKLWMVHKDNPVLRDSEIEKYKKITEKMITKFHPVKTTKKYVEKAPLTYEATLPGKEKETYAVLYDPDEKDAEESIYLYAKEAFFKWKTGKNVIPDPALKKKLLDTPMMVLADGVSDANPKPFLTADYDLLAIGFYEPNAPFGEPQDVKEAEFDDIYGACTAEQIKLIGLLNAEVKRTGYTGGNVTHHGPEVQYGGSPYVDYPILVCDPGKPDVIGDSSVYIIRQGPLGFRDIHLKRFFTEGIRRGYNLWPNPVSKGWQWEYEKYRKFSKEQGFDPRDAPTLLGYVQEQSDPDLEGKADTNLGAEKDKKVDGDIDLDDLFDEDEKNDVDAQLKVANKYLNRDGGELDQKFLKEVIIPASEKKNTTAMALYAESLIDGWSGKIDAAKAHRILTEALKKDDHPMANTQMGRLYYYGEGVERDDDKAYKHFKKASEKNERYGNLFLGMMLFEGNGKNEETLKRAFNLFTTSAKQGVSAAHTYLGNYYHYAYIFEKDHKKALEHYMKAVIIDDEPEALLQIAYLYCKPGSQFKPDIKKAVRYYKLAAEQDSAEAQYELARLYRDGKGVKKDLKNAYVLFKLSSYVEDEGPEKMEFEALKKQLTKEQIQAAEELYLQVLRELAK